METKKATIKSEAVFSDDKNHRLFLRREWDRNKPTALVIMINPSSSALIHTDITTVCILNNLEALDYGAVEIANMYSLMTNKISFRFNSDEVLLHPDTDAYIMKSAEKAQLIIIAWGTIGENNQRVKKRQHDILKLLEKHSHKMKLIGDTTGRIGLHPLTPQVRNGWILEDFAYEAWMKNYQASLSLVKKSEPDKKKSVKGTSEKAEKAGTNSVKPQENEAITSCTTSEPAQAVQSHENHSGTQEIAS